MAGLVKYFQDGMKGDIHIVVLDLFPRTGNRGTGRFEETKRLFNSQLNKVSADDVARISRKIKQYHCCTGNLCNIENEYQRGRRASGPQGK